MTEEARAAGLPEDMAGVFRLDGPRTNGPGGGAGAGGLPEDVAGIFRLDGQRTIVTGAASGLGKAIALGFAHFGADVACLDIDLEAAGETAGPISDLGAQSAEERRVGE